MLGKGELSQRLGEKTGMGSSKANQMLTSVLDTITEALARGEEVRVTGFGSFRVMPTKERMRMNPRTREQFHVPAGKRIAFSPGAQLNSAVRGEMGRKAA